MANSVPDRRPVVLVILDGFGISPISEGNAVMKASTPWLDWAIATVDKALLHASGSEVGLDWGEVGNSEVGHLNLGTGRIVMQDLPRINRAIEDGSFFANAALGQVARKVGRGTLHVVGLASEGGVHAHLDHLLAMLDFAKQQRIKRVALHLIADGRDTPPTQLGKDVPKIHQSIKVAGVGQIASVSGRFFAMDRDARWERTEAAYRAIVEGKGREAESIEAALDAAEAAKETDEFITPTVITRGGTPVAPVAHGDVVVFTNFRPDRTRQLSAALTNPDFTEFKRGHGPVSHFVSFTSYGQESTPNIEVAFFAPKVEGQLAAVIAAKGLTQRHLAESEKYAHVTYFLNGGVEAPFAGEQRTLIPSPKVATYDLKPPMSAVAITRQFLSGFKQPEDFTVINFANPDMVGHTGNLKATVSAIETVDAQLVSMTKAVQAAGATLIVTADHGNAEQLVNPETKAIDKEHTTNPVPVFIVPPDRPLAPIKASANHAEHIQFAATKPAGVLADIAPTVLDYLGLDKPSAMTGQSLKGLL